MVLGEIRHVAKVYTSGEASRWRVCYQRGLPRLAYLLMYFFFATKCSHSLLLLLMRCQMKAWLAKNKESSSHYPPNSSPELLVHASTLYSTLLSLLASSFSLLCSIVKSNLISASGVSYEGNMLGTFRCPGALM